VLFLYVPDDRKLFFAALAVILVALATDFADGYLARRWAIFSETGYILDGLADRSFYVALVLTMVAAHSLSLVIAWLLIGREIAMYALRLAGRDEWFDKNRQVRHLSLWHAGSIRLWFGTYFVADSLGLLTTLRPYDNQVFVALQILLLLVTLIAGYFSVARLLAPLL
jgi:cardiolipin synthase